jgi:WD40 repeat protein
MSDDEHQRPESEEHMGAWLAACDDAMAVGSSPEELCPADLPPELRLRLEGDLAFLERLRLDLRPGAAPTSPETPDPGSTLDLRPVMAPVPTGALEPGPASQPPASGLGRFRIRRELGRGGFGVVYLADDPRLGRAVALKVPRADALAAPELRQRFFQEARAAAALDHPNLVPVYEAGEAGPVCFIASAFCPGSTLADWLRGRTEPVPFSLAARLVATLADAVQHAHSRGVVHRDLKPANVLLETTESHGPGGPGVGPDGPPDLVPRITDFGLAKLVSDSTGAGPTRSGVILGTPSYMAPEQAKGQSRDVGPAADVYALGAILYELLTGRPPFRGESDLDTLRQVLDDEPVMPRRLRAGVPLDLETIVQKAMAREPRRRYETASALADDLNRFLEGRPILARRVSAVERCWRWCLRNPATAALLTSLALLLAAVAAGTSTAYVRESRLRAQAVASEAQVRAEAESNRRLRYASDVQLAGQLWESDEGTAEQVAALLAAQEPAPGQADLREFAWRYQWTLLDRSSIALAGHDGAIPALAFTPEGHLATIDGAGALRVWDPARRIVVHSLGPSLRPQDVPAAGLPTYVLFEPPEFPRRLRVRDVTAVELAHNGRTFAEATRDSVRLRDAATGVELRAWPRSGPARLLAFSPDGQWLAALGHDGTVTVADTVSGRETVLGSTHVGNAKPSNATALVVAADGRTVWVANAPQSGGIMALGGPTPRLWPTDPFPVWSIAVSPDGRRLASGHFQSQVRLWDAQAAGTRQADWRPNSGRVTALAFAADGQTLATGGSDAAIATWDVATARQKRRFKGHLGAIRGLVFSDDGAALASSDARGVARLWDLSGPSASRRLTEIPAEQHFYLAYSRDGRWLATAGKMEAMVWDAHSGKLAHRLPADPSYVYRVAFAPDSRTLATGGRDSAVKLWDVASGKLVRSLPGRPSDHRYYPHDAVGALAFSHDGTRLAAGFGRPGLHDPDYDQVVKVWDVASGRELRTLTGLKNTVPMMAFAPDDRTLAAACHDGTVRLWSTATWDELRTLRGPAPWQSLAFAPDGRTLAAGVESSGLIRLWDAASGRALRDLRGHASEVGDLSFAPDGRTIASASSDRTVKLWDLATGRELSTLRSQKGGTAAAAFAPDGLTLATSSSEGVRLWEAASFAEVAAAQAAQRAEATPSGAGPTPAP